MKHNNYIYKVDLKPRWNFAAKFYFVCLIIFMLLMTYVMIYRSIYKSKIIENVKNNNHTVSMIQ